MRSLRGQLLVGLGIAAAIVFLTAGVSLDSLLGRALRDEFDAALTARARALAGLVEHNEDGLEFDAPTETPEPDGPDVYQMWGPDGDVVVRSASLGAADLDQLQRASPTPAFCDATLPDGRSARLVSLTFEPRREDVAHDEPKQSVTLVVGRATRGLLATLARVRAILVAVCVIAIALSASATWLLVRHSLGPLNRLSRQLGAVDADALDTCIDLAGLPEELWPVVERLNSLLARLDDAFRRERRFTGDVAHELRTPLAGLRSKLELALSRERDPNAYRAVLRDCLAIDLEMQKLVECLLDLARADAGRFELRPEPVAIADLLRERWTRFEAPAATRGLTIDWRLQDVAVTQIDPHWVRIAIDKILENAVEHASGAGYVTVSLSDADGATIVTVANPTQQLSIGEAARVFDRFWRGDANPATNGHYGLGASLSKAIIERLGGSITAESDAGEFTIRIKLPRRLSS